MKENSFIAEKYGTKIEVFFDKGVRIKVIHTIAETENAVIMITKSEQILAQIHLGKTPCEDSLNELKLYFSNRGWKVMEQDNTAP